MATSKIPEKKPTGELTAAQVIEHLTQENEQLRLIVQAFETDGMYSLFFAVNRKANEMARALNGSTLSLEGKSIPNFQGMMKGMKETFQTVNELRNEYLKITDDSAKEMETKGTPLIEQRANMKPVA